MEALQFEPTGRKKRVERFFLARCSTCRETLHCPTDVEPWGWVKTTVDIFKGQHDHGQVNIEVKIVEKD